MTLKVITLTTFLDKLLPRLSYMVLVYYYFLKVILTTF
jgi:hypothetical protein